ncbi:MAG: phage tail sheath family protein [Acidobacteria bacterium]|nr:phage tail sheath family protein [Acidobacteriota bacterium]
MTDGPTIPGVYVDDVRARDPLIAGASTAVTAFVGAASSGVIDTPVLVRSVAEFERPFGDLARACPMSYAVSQFFANGGTDAVIVRVESRTGAALTDDDVSADWLEGDRKGLWALEHADTVDLLCIPPFTFDSDISAQTRAAAVRYAAARRAMFIADPLIGWTSASEIVSGTNSIDSATWGVAPDPNATLHVPRMQCADPLQGGRLADFVPCGAIAGVFARTDRRRGVWKAPAGVEATLTGAVGATVALTDNDNRQLTERGVNGLRVLPRIGPVVWGARTTAGADALASDWKYVPIRRTALFIEKSLIRGTTWARLEPNDDPLWARLRLGVDTFMHGLFRQGAFQGSTPKEAWFVRCDSTTTTEHDIDTGLATIVVGFAPLRPAEFVVITVRVPAGRGGPVLS